jgi:isoamylase
MSDEDWNAGFVKCLGVRLAGDLINDESERGEPIVGETLLLLLNGHWEPISFTLPQTHTDHIWDRILDTADLSEHPRDYQGGQQYVIQDRSLALLAARTPRDKGLPLTPAQLKAVLSEPRGASYKPPGASPI